MNDQAKIRITTIVAEPSYTPTEEQIKRAEARRRFNRSYVYAPIFLLTAVVLGLTGLMIWSIFAPNAAESAAFLSGIADIILILVLLPTIMIWGAIVGLPIGYYVKRYQERRQEPTPDQRYVRQYGRFRILIWQLEYKIDQLADFITNRLLPAITRPLIRTHQIGAAIMTWLHYWYDTLTQPNNQ